MRAAKPHGFGGCCSQKTKAFSVFFVKNTRPIIPRTVPKYLAAAVTRYRKEALREHAATKIHKAAIEAKMNQRVSLFQSQYKEQQTVRNNVFFNAFAALYWLANEAVVNTKSFYKDIALLLRFFWVYISALADKFRNVPPKSKEKFCHDKFLFPLLHSH